MTEHVIAVTGGKGGVGKSTTTVNLGVSLRLDGYSVALVDADIEMPNLVELLSIEPQYTIHDVLSGTAETADAIVEIGNGFAAIPGGSSISSYGTVEPEQLQAVVGTLERSYDFVLLDTGAGLSYDDILPLGLADEIILVSSPDAAAIENAKRTQAFVKRLNREVRGLVITKADEPIDSSIADQFGTTLLGVIPNDEAVRQSTAAGQPIELYAPDSPAAQAYRQLEANLTDGVLPPQRSGQGTSSTSEPPTTESEPEPPASPAPPAPPPTEEEPIEDTDDPPRGLVERVVGFFTV